MNAKKEPVPLDVALAEELLARMAVARMRPGQLAERSGIPYRTLKRYLDAERVMVLGEIKAVAGALGDDWQELLRAAELRERGE